MGQTRLHRDWLGGAGLPDGFVEEPSGKQRCRHEEKEEGKGRPEHARYEERDENTEQRPSAVPNDACYDERRGRVLVEGKPIWVKRATTFRTPVTRELDDLVGTMRALESWRA